MYSLQNRIALVTGGSLGIGRATAHLLRQRGATVIITGRNQGRLAQAAAEIDVDYLAGDVSREADVIQLFEKIRQDYGRLDILVNNAGLTRDNLSMRMKEEEWREVLDVNLTAPFMLAKACQRGMMKRRHGRIINISSVVGTTGNPGQCNYVA